MGTIDRSEYVRWFYRTFNEDTVSNPSKLYKLIRTRTGTNNARWKDQILAHTQAGTGLSGARETIRLAVPTGGALTITNTNRPKGTQTFTVSGHLAGYRYTSPTMTNPSISLGNARALAYSKALKQIHKVQTSFQGGVFLGEMREALHMLRHPGEGLMTAVKRDYLDALVRKKNEIKKLRGLKTPNIPASDGRWKQAIAQTWLEKSFGWVPFLNDLEDAGNAYQKLQERETRFEKIRAVGKEKQFIGSSTEQFAPTSDFYFAGQTVTTEEAIVVVRGEVKAQAETTPLEKARLFGLSPNEFIPTAWELLPWSFLIDYFTNIGDILENSITDTTNVTWLIESDIKTRTLKGMVRPDCDKCRSLHSTDPKFSCGGSQGRIWLERREVGRVPNPTLTVPPLMFEIPGSPAKWANMAALWIQANSIHPQNAKFLGGRRIS